jgi:DNA-binding NarL/FixJ family response regulator
MPKGKSVKKSADVRVFIVDDHPIVRQGLRQLVEHEPDMMVCGEAESAVEGLRNIGKCRPDIAVVDLTLKDGNGLDLTRDIRTRYPQTRVLVLSMHDAAIYAERALRAGAMGYLMKEEATELVIGALRTILRGEVFLTESIAQRMLQKVASGKAERGGSPLDVLSDRELEVFRLVGQGISTREIASRLHRSVKTIDSHRENIKRKLSLNSAADLLQHAIQWVQSEAP